MKLKYGRSFQELDISQIGSYQVLTNSDIKNDDNEIEIIKNALNYPIGSNRIGEIVKPGDKVCIAISDITRAYQKTSLWLPYIIDELTDSGIKDEDIVILSATGAHREQTEEEHKELIGEDLYSRFEVIDHKCNDSSSLSRLGTTQRGTPIEINKLAVECDHLVITGAVSLHDMAGYGGGRKAIMPGIASYEAVSNNHLQVFGEKSGSGIHPNCKLGSIDNNPMNLDMMEALEAINISFMFNVVLDNYGNIYKAVAGDYIEAHKIGTKYCDEISCVNIDKRSDVVIASAGGYPKDINLYQVSKAFSGSVEGVKEGGTLIIVAECIEDMGTVESVEIIKDYSNNYDREMFMRNKFCPEAYSGYLISLYGEKYDIRLVTYYKDINEIEKSGITFYSSVDDAMEDLYKDENNKLTYIIPDASGVLLKYNQKSGGVK